jgi:hypothetical protein
MIFSHIKENPEMRKTIMKKRFSKLVKLMIATALLCGMGLQAQAGGRVNIMFVASNFPTPATTINNPYWPLVPGEVFTYHAEEGDECIINAVETTTDTKPGTMFPDPFGGIYAGIVARVVYDREWVDEDCDGDRDTLTEETWDWYAQDSAGNIWYFGEDTIEYEYDDDGNFLGTSSDGSWEAGRDVAGAGSDAEPGIIMLANPHSGDFYLQEFYEDEAEDMGKVLRLNAKVEGYEGVACLQTKEWNRLERGVVEHKFYCPPTGLVYIKELNQKTVHVNLE